MRRKLTALFVMVTVFIASLSPSIQAIAESTVFHDMGGYRMRHNLDGSVTMEIYPEIEMVREGSGTEDASAAQEAEIPFQSEFTSAFTPGQALMTLTMGDGHVSFTPVMLEGLVTVTEEEEPETG
ncbi:MAG: hypothetical protein FWF69_05645, partial [Firmicutes bacterium]|nr:hypothetical protein [Bacillota bacterium]